MGAHEVTTSVPCVWIQDASTWLLSMHDEAVHAFLLRQRCRAATFSTQRKLAGILDTHQHLGSALHIAGIIYIPRRIGSPSTRVKTQQTLQDPTRSSGNRSHFLSAWHDRVPESSRGTVYAPWHTSTTSFRPQSRHTWDECSQDRPYASPAQHAFRDVSWHAIHSTPTKPTHRATTTSVGCCLSPQS